MVPHNGLKRVKSVTFWIYVNHLFRHFVANATLCYQGECFKDIVPMMSRLKYFNLQFRQFCGPMSRDNFAEISGPEGSRGLRYKFDSQSLFWRQLWQFLLVMKFFYRNVCGLFDDIDGNCYLRWNFWTL